jgi:ribosomal protein S18 acetylase RimI-like enzyme
MIRSATLADLDALVEIEKRCFEIDRFSRRSFRYLLTKANAETIVDIRDGDLLAYVMLLFNMGTSLARVYSIAVDPKIRGQGIAAALLEKAEQVTLEHDCVYIRSEIRTDNKPSQSLFTKHGYKQFGMIKDYYEDHADALRYEKILVPLPKPDIARVPYYEQTLEFTCGPSALMMAMKSLDPKLTLDRKLELRIWRESTTIYMTSGHGGCGPYGMALSAYHRGFDVEIYVKDESALFVDSVRSPDKKEVLRLVQEDFLDEIEHLPIQVQYRALSVHEIQEKFEAGGIPVVLISSYRIYREKFPHWVVVTGFDERFIYLHDPYIDYEANKSSTDVVNMPILKKDFERMAKYGKAGQKSVLIIKQRKQQRKVAN